MLEITKLRILKATHNKKIARTKPNSVVRDHKVTNFESNSQPMAFCISTDNVVRDQKVTNLKNNVQYPLCLNLRKGIYTIDFQSCIIL